MSLRFLCDQCVPTEISDFLRQQGHQVVLLRDVLPIQAPDSTVIKMSQELQAVLVSLNGDFSDIVAYPPANYLGIIGIQLHNHPEIIPFLLNNLRGFLTLHPEQEYYHGKLIIVEVHRIRIRS
jgi:predicted nuclease of predicted toxin-antitoxin system